METKLYEFADDIVWPDNRLDRHYSGLLETSRVSHSEPRATEIRRELAHVAFEAECRSLEKQGILVNGELSEAWKTNQ